MAPAGNDNARPRTLVSPHATTAPQPAAKTRVEPAVRRKIPPTREHPTIPGVIQPKDRSRGITLRGEGTPVEVNVLGRKGNLFMHTSRDGQGFGVTHGPSGRLVAEVGSRAEARALLKGMGKGSTIDRALSGDRRAALAGNRYMDRMKAAALAKAGKGITIRGDGERVEVPALAREGRLFVHPGRTAGTFGVTHGPSQRLVAEVGSKAEALQIMHGMSKGRTIERALAGDKRAGLAGNRYMDRVKAAAAAQRSAIERAATEKAMAKAGKTAARQAREAARIDRAEARLMRAAEAGKPKAPRAAKPAGGGRAERGGKGRGGGLKLGGLPSVQSLLSPVAAAVGMAPSAIRGAAQLAGL